ncbi:MAG TPA: YraN family protein [Candidatus Saccharimonadales bacterium]|nr:YraN family protein [Candidatus Saccharimonadales bacterium]
MATKTGRVAEDLAANFLRNQGLRIIAQNWRTRWCEIDLIAEKGGVTHIIEVKYRANLSHGSGLEYITRSKLEQMVKASRFYQSENTNDGPIQIDAIAVTGSIEQPKIDWLENLTL